MKAKIHIKSNEINEVIHKFEIDIEVDNMKELHEVVNLFDDILIIQKEKMEI